SPITTQAPSPKEPIKDIFEDGSKDEGDEINEQVKFLMDVHNLGYTTKGYAHRSGDAGKDAEADEKLGSIAYIFEIAEELFPCRELRNVLREGKYEERGSLIMGELPDVALWMRSHELDLTSRVKCNVGNGKLVASLLRVYWPQGPTSKKYYSAVVAQRAKAMVELEPRMSELLAFVWYLAHETSEAHFTKLQRLGFAWVYDHIKATTMRDYATDVATSPGSTEPPSKRTGKAKTAALVEDVAAVKKGLKALSIM
ncbi:MAG: hypothetical protein ACYCPS_06305, partial [Candidatus Saccharimonadales bacterium]